MPMRLLEKETREVEPQDPASLGTRLQLEEIHAHPYSLNELARTAKGIVR